MSDPPIARQWYVKVAEREFGPYAFDLLSNFAAQGRLTVASFVRAEGEAVWIAAIDDPVLRPLFEKRLRPEPPMEAAASNFVVVAELRQANTASFDLAVSKIGESHRLNATVWVVHSTNSVGEIRNHLIQQLGKADSLLVIDCMTAKSAWFNLTPDTEARLRKLWKRPRDGGG